jgi:branched-chain amino acid aminotransferase
MSQPAFICLDGEVVPFDQAKIHVLSPAVKYAAHVFEGLRAYWNDKDGRYYLFRLEEHAQRLRQSMRMTRMQGEYSAAFLKDCIERTIKANKFQQDVHIRASAYVGGDGNIPDQGPTILSVSVLAQGRWTNKGVTCAVSSWERIADNAAPPRIKSAANYHNGRLAWMQAKADGYDHVLMLTRDGKVSEGPGSCFFLIRDGIPITPAVTDGILESITRSTLIQLFSEYLSTPVVERSVDRSELYCAEEAFFCGTGQEIIPVISIDRMPVGSGEIGERTQEIWKVYQRIVRGEVNDHSEWRNALTI